jgi:hypothetical protein
VVVVSMTPARQLWCSLTLQQQDFIWFVFGMVMLGIIVYLQLVVIAGGRF